jgi:hypothetical protein
VNSALAAPPARLKSKLDSAVVHGIVKNKNGFEFDQFD